MRKRRFKPKVLWLPVSGNDVSSVPEEEHWVNGPQGAFVVANTGEIVFDATPCTFDYSDAPSTEQGSFNRSLQDLASGNNYRLRRIVGKIHAGVRPTSSAASRIQPVEVAAGFIVNRTDDSGNLVIASTLEPQTATPLAQDSAQDPWIWRRKWMLSPYPPGYTSSTAANVIDFATGPVWPQTTAGYGSVADGPHIDQKTARVIANQERLFFWIAARQRNDDSGAADVTLQYNLDIRILASLRSSQGNRRNASR